MGSFVEQVVPVLVFLLAITVVAEIAQLAGLFDVAGHTAVRLARGRVWLLWAAVVVLACAATILLSLDTTAVLLTPVVLAAARRVRIDPLPFAMATVWLANTASLLLPVSNLSNLLAAYHFRRWGGVHGYLAATWRPALVAVAVTVVVLVALHARSLRGRYETGPAPAGHDPLLLWISGLVCLALGPAFVSGLPPAVPACVAAAVLLALLAVRDRPALRRIGVPWGMVLVLAAVFALVQLLPAAPVLALAGEGDGTWALLRLAGAGASVSNVVNNLPAYLALEAAADSPARMTALLVGVDLGPVVTLWASLATVLWRQRCIRAGLTIPLGTFAWQGLLLVMCVVPAAVLAI